MIGKAISKGEQICYYLGFWDLCKEFIEVSSTDQLFLDKMFALLKRHRLSTDHLDMIIEAICDSLNIILFLSESRQRLVKYASQLAMLLNTVNLLLLQ